MENITSAVCRSLASGAWRRLGQVGQAFQPDFVRFPDFPRYTVRLESLTYGKTPPAAARRKGLVGPLLRVALHADGAFSPETCGQPRCAASKRRRQKLLGPSDAIRRRGLRSSSTLGTPVRDEQKERLDCRRPAGVEHRKIGGGNGNPWGDAIVVHAERANNDRGIIAHNLGLGQIIADRAVCFVTEPLVPTIR